MEMNISLCVAEFWLDAEARNEPGSFEAGPELLNEARTLNPNPLKKERQHIKGIWTEPGSFEAGLRAAQRTRISKPWSSGDGTTAHRKDLNWKLHTRSEAGFATAGMDLALLGIVLSFSCVFIVLGCLVILLTLVSFDFVCVRYVCRVLVRGRMCQSLGRQLFLFQLSSSQLIGSWEQNWITCNSLE